MPRPRSSRTATPSILGLAWWWPALAGLLAVALIVLAAVAFARGSTEAAAVRRADSSYTPPAAATPAAAVTWDQAVARLSDGSRPWTVAVVGDSTGYGPDRWVDQFAALVAQQRHRQVVLHDWDDGKDDYEPARTIGSGGAPIAIWNAAAPGRTPDYSEDHLAAMIPSDVVPDVIVVNHGDNTGPDIAHDLTGLTDALTYQFPAAPLALTVQNPARGDGAADAKERAAQELTDAQQHGWRVIDAYSAFTKQQDLGSLYVDDRHENARGGLLWARTAVADTGI